MKLYMRIYVYTHIYTISLYISFVYTSFGVCWIVFDFRGEFTRGCQPTQPSERLAGYKPHKWGYVLNPYSLSSWPYSATYSLIQWNRSKSQPPSRAHATHRAVEVAAPKGDWWHQSRKAALKISPSIHQSLRLATAVISCRQPTATGGDYHGPWSNFVSRCSSSGNDHSWGVQIQVVGDLPRRGTREEGGALTVFQHFQKLFTGGFRGLPWGTQLIPIAHWWSFD